MHLCTHPHSLCTYPIHPSYRRRCAVVPFSKPEELHINEQSNVCVTAPLTLCRMPVPARFDCSILVFLKYDDLYHPVLVHLFVHCSFLRSLNFWVFCSFCVFLFLYRQVARQVAKENKVQI
jgi:hypothetical protein